MKSYVFHAADRHPRARTGYTLIEMLIAVTLVAVLMTVVWGLMSMYTTLQTAGAEATAERQLVRSVMQLIRDDLQSVPLAVPQADDAAMDPFAAFEPVESENRADEFVFAGDTTVFDIADLIRNENSGPANVEFRGERYAIRLTFPVAAAPRAKPNPDTFEVSEAAVGLPEGIAPVVSEFQSVVYQFQPYGETTTADMPAGLYRVQSAAAHLQGLLVSQPQRDGEPVRDAIRLKPGQIEELLFPSDGDRNPEAGPHVRAAACDLIPDVTGGGFEYYDGNGWSTEWNADRAGHLPVAIRITLDVISAVQLEELSAAQPKNGEPSRLERHVRRTFTRVENRPPRTPATALTTETRVTPRQYQATLLLDPAVRITDSNSQSGWSAEGVAF